MENTFYGEFSEQEKQVLNGLNGLWVFWKVQNGKRFGFYAWNHTWPKDNRIVAGDFVEFSNTLNDVQPEPVEEEKPVERSYHPIGTTLINKPVQPAQPEQLVEEEGELVEVEVFKGEDDDLQLLDGEGEGDPEELRYDYMSGPDVSWEDVAMNEVERIEKEVEDNPPRKFGKAPPDEHLMEMMRTYRK